MRGRAIRWLAAVALAVVGGCGEWEDDPEVAEATEELGVIPPPCLAAPTISSPAVTAPSPSQLTTRGNIRYLAGTQVDIALTIPTCASVTGVLYGGTALATSPGIDGAIWYSVVSDVSAGTGYHRVTVRLNLRAVVNGSSWPVQVRVQNIWASTVTYNFPLVRVKEIATHASVSLTATELENELIAGIYDRFGDDGEYVENAGEDLEIVLDDPSYGDLWIDDAGVHLHFTARVNLPKTIGDVNLPHTCDPTISISGTFGIEDSSSGAYAVWTAGPTFSIDFPPLICPSISSAMVQDVATDMLNDLVNGIIADKTDPVCTLIACSFTTSPGELRMIAPDPPFDRVVIEVPYNTIATNEPWLTGVALNAGEAVAVAVSEQSLVCTSAGTAGIATCAAVEASPSGLFNWNSAPVPSPWILVGTVWAYYPERHQARNQLVGLTRTMSKLPIPNAHPGSTVARFANGPATTDRSAFYRVGAPCLLHARTGGEDRLAFGANDYRTSTAAEYGSGVWRITIGFPAAILAAAIPECL